MAAPATARSGPLSGIRVVELAALGPGPFATMLLGELGADVIRIDRLGPTGYFDDAQQFDLLNRGKRSIALDLKDPDDLAVVHRLIARSDILVEGFRPGVAERLGVGPEICLEANPRLVYGRMTGWGQDGPLSSTAGHDIDYISITGALGAIGSADGPPVLPLNLVGDFGGGGMYLAVGVLAALRHATATGQGQVVDAAISDGAAHLLTGTHGLMAAGLWEDRRGVNIVDGGAPYYGVYATSDACYLAVGAIEPRFYRKLLDGLGLELDAADQDRQETWPATRDTIAARVAERTLAEWLQVFDGSDACVAPVVSIREAVDHPHMRARETLRIQDGLLQAAPAPRFSATRTQWPSPPPRPGQHQQEILRELDA
ncbi:CaiB/BaiF CoA transferase family protein [bacterium RCC_150]